MYKIQVTLARSLSSHHVWIYAVITTTDNTASTRSDNVVQALDKLYHTQTWAGLYSSSTNQEAKQVCKKQAYQNKRIGLLKAWGKSFIKV